MSRELTWRALADLLAERMSNHAYCPDHLESRSADECPFCQDRVAFRAWERKTKRQRTQAGR